MAALQFNAIEATFGAIFGNGHIAGDDVANFFVRYGFWYFTKQRVGNGTGGPHRHAAVHAACLAAVVIDLGKNWRAVAMHCRRDASVTRNHIAMETVNQFLIRPVGGMRGVLFGDDEPRATFGASGVIGGVLFGWLAIAGVVREMRAKHQSIFCGDWTQLQGGPQVAVTHVGKITWLCWEVSARVRKRASLDSECGE